MHAENLQFAAAAEILAQVALHTESPTTIGVFGNWRSGKISQMRLMYKIVHTLDEKDHAAMPVRLNAWQYEREEHLVIPLIPTIARYIKKKQEQWEKLTLNTKVNKAVNVSLKKTIGGGDNVHKALRAEPDRRNKVADAARA